MIRTPLRRQTRLRAGGKKKPGSTWRVLAWRETRGGGSKVELDSGMEPSIFDEVVVDDWLHVEQMDDGLWWLAVYEKKKGKPTQQHVIWISVRRNGDVEACHDVETL